MKKMFFVMLVLCFFSFAMPLELIYAAASAQPAAGDPKPETTITMTERRTSVSVAHTGTDTIGIKLSTRLKELFNGSNLFKLNEENAPKIRLIVTTKAEFSDRPHVGTVYSIIWSFNQREGLLGYLLAHDVGVLTPEDIENLAAQIIERTDGLAVKYAYLFQ